MENTNTTQKDTKHFSRGEKIFNWVTYGGIAGLGTFIVTIPIVYWTKYGRGSNRFHEISSHLKSTGLSDQTTEQLMMTTATAQGGNLTVLPVKWAEDHKIAIVTKINDMLGEKTDVAELQSHQKQSWSSIVKARIVSWGVVFIGLKATEGIIGKDKFTQFENKFSEHLVCKPLGIATHINGERTKAFKYGKIAAFDVFATAASCALLYIGSRFFARKKSEDCAPKIEEKSHAEIYSQPVYHNSSDAPSPRVSQILSTRHKDDGFAASIANRSNEPAQLGA